MRPGAGVIGLARKVLSRPRSWAPAHGEQPVAMMQNRALTSSPRRTSPSQRPCARPSGRHHLGLEGEVALQVVFVGDGLGVGQDLRLGGVISRSSATSFCSSGEPGCRNRTDWGCRSGRPGIACSSTRCLRHRRRPRNPAPSGQAAQPLHSYRGRQAGPHDHHIDVLPLDRRSFVRLPLRPRAVSQTVAQLLFESGIGDQGRARQPDATSPRNGQLCGRVSATANSAMGSISFSLISGWRARSCRRWSFDSGRRA